MRFLTITSVLAVALAAFAAEKDDFKREGNPKQRAQKDPLEGKAPPSLKLESWLNVKGGQLKLKDLKGKVVVLKFWGVW